MIFTGPLKILNGKPPVKGKANFLEAFHEVTLPGECYTELGMWLEGEVNNSTPGDAYEGVMSFIEHQGDRLSDVAKQGRDPRNAIGYFLVEAMRCANFTKHDSDIIRFFVEKFRALSYSLDDKDVGQCIDRSTFRLLTWDPPNKVTMKV